MRKYFIIFSCLILLIGAGCSKNKAEDVEKTQSNSDEEKPLSQEEIDIVELQHAYINCIENGNETALRFDLETNRTKLFCLVDGQFECGALEFDEGTCPDEKNILKFPTGGENNFESEGDRCTLDVKPVCGADKYTYVNECIARLQNIEIDHKGECVRAKSPDENSRSSGGSSGRSSQPSAGGDGGTATPPTETEIWLDILIDFASTESTKRYTTIEKCAYSGKNVYLKAGSCEKCFSVLYDEKGAVMCYPKNDLQNNCPGYFDMNRRRGSCSVIWRGN